MFSIDKQNKIKITKGDYATFKVHVWKGKEEQTDGTITFTVRATPDTQQYLIQKTAEDGVIEIESSDTSNAACGLYVYDIQWEDEEEHISTIIKSFFEITEEITR